MVSELRPLNAVIIGLGFGAEFISNYQKQGSGHGGSHPHLVNEFVQSLVEDRDPWPNAVTSANLICVGILAHESAMCGGEIRRLPDITQGK